MKVLNKIILDDLQQVGLNPYAIMQQLIDHIFDIAETGTTFNDEYDYLRDVLSDQSIRFNW